MTATFYLGLILALLVAHWLTGFVYAGLVFFGFLYAPVNLVLGLLGNALSRRHEFAADAFAARTTGRPDAMIDALKKLSVHNLSNLTPHPLKVIMDYSHPPVLQRIAALRDVDDPTGFMPIGEGDRDPWSAPTTQCLPPPG